MAANDVQLVPVDPPSPYLCSASSTSRYHFDSRKGSFTGASLDTDSASNFGRPRLQESARFYGEWRDSLGHYICVNDAPSRGYNAGQKFSAVLSRPNSRDKTLAIRRDQFDGNRWICGNGYLDGSKSNCDLLVWETEDGRISEWNRIPPNGPVFFDPPPYLMKQFAVERRPRTRRSGPEKIVPSLIETSHLCDVDEETGLLVWRLQDEWEKLKNFPANCCITSPKFTSEFGGSEAMQVLFYPTGMHSEKSSSSVLSLTRESVDWCDLAGLKVEFFINGISLGKKVFHNYRTDLEVARPSDDTTDVVISIALHKK